MLPRKRRLSYKKERCLLSDVLPYEIPVSFSNRHFYAFLLRHKIEIKNDAIYWVKGSAALERNVHLLFCLPENQNRLSDVQEFVGEHKVDFRRYLSYPGRKYGRFLNISGLSLCHFFIACKGVLLPKADCGSFWL